MADNYRVSTDRRLAVSLEIETAEVVRRELGGKPVFSPFTQDGASRREEQTLSQRERGHCLGVLTNSEYALERIKKWSGHPYFGVRREEHSFATATLPESPNSSPE